MSSVLSMAPWGFLFTHKGKGPATGSQTPGILLLPRDFLSHQLTSEPFKLDFLHPRCPLLLFPAPPPITSSSTPYPNHFSPLSNSSSFLQHPPSLPHLSPHPLQCLCCYISRAQSLKSGHRTRRDRWSEPGDSL